MHMGKEHPAVSERKPHLKCWRVFPLFPTIVNKVILEKSKGPLQFGCYFWITINVAWSWTSSSACSSSAPLCTPPPPPPLYMSFRIPCCATGLPTFLWLMRSLWLEKLLQWVTQSGGGGAEGLPKSRPRTADGGGAPAASCTVTTFFQITWPFS